MRTNVCLRCWLAGMLATLVVGASWATPTLSVGTARGYPGSTVTFDVSWRADGAQATAVGAKIFFDPRNTPVATDPNGQPDCWKRPDLGKSAGFAWRPLDCDGEDCDAVRALVYHLSNQDPVPSGVLFTCRVRISPTAPLGRYGLIADYAGAADRSGNPVQAARSDGYIDVVAPPGEGCHLAGPAFGGPSWLLVGLVLATLFALRRQLRCRSLAWLACTALPSLGLVASPLRAQVQTWTTLEIEGSWKSGMESGRWSGQISAFTNGAFSGRIRLHGHSKWDEVCISGTWSSWLQGGMGKVSDAATGNAIGTFSVAASTSGIRATWTPPAPGPHSFAVTSIRPATWKRAPAEIEDSLRQGQAQRVMVTFDDYPIVRRLREQQEHRTSDRPWVEDQAFTQRYEAELARLMGKVGNDLSSVAGLRMLDVSGNTVLVELSSLDALGTLLRHPQVLAVTSDRSLELQLSESLPLIGQPLVADRLRETGTPLP